MSEFDLNELDYNFQTKPLLIGGMAMEYYGLRQAGDDIDFVISLADYNALAEQYPDHKREIFGDQGIAVGKYELWKTICLFGYDFLSAGAIEKEHYCITSLEKMLFLKALGYKEEKYRADLELIVDKIINIQYGQDTLPE